MSATYARSEYSDENLHRRDGSLLRRKREQWAKERAEVDSWFPFGSPGGGAPNKKYEAVSPVQLEKPENRPSSCRSNGDSGQWSDSENVGPNKEISDQESRRSEVSYPYMTASISSATSTVYLPTGTQLSEGPTFQPLPHIAAAPNNPYMPSTNGSIPVQLVCPPIPYGHAVPIPVELSQGQTSQFSVVYPLRLLPSAPTSCSASGGIEDRRADMSSNATYTEQWANQLPYWGTTGSCKDDPLSPKEITPAPFPSIPAAQPLAVVKPMVIPLVTPSHIEQTYSPANPSGCEDAVHGSMSESSTSLNSSYRRIADSEYTGRASISEQAISEQIAEKHRAEVRRAEEEKREAMKKEDERLRMEELERSREMEEERRKKEAEEQQKKREEAVLAAIEEAKRNAEKLRKAKLYKHVLEDTENTADLEHSILGDDAANNVKILKEVESMERQKKYELRNLERKPKASAKKKDEGVRITERRMSLDDERPIRPSRLNRTYSGHSKDEEPLERSRRGRQSLRLPTPERSLLNQRTSSLERQAPESSKGNVTGKSNVRKPTLSCSIPVRPQRRIPPPSVRSRRSSVSNEVDVVEVSTPDEVCTDVISIDNNVQSLNKTAKETNGTGKKSTSTELCYEYLFPATSTSGTSVSATPSVASGLKPISATPFRAIQQRRSSNNALSLLSDIPLAEEKKAFTKRKTSHPNEDSFLQVFFNTSTCPSRSVFNPFHSP